MKTPLQELMEYMEQNQYFIGNDLLAKYKELIEQEKEHAVYFADLETKIDAYKECFEQFIPVDKWDEATRFLSTYKNGLAKDFEKKERL